MANEISKTVNLSINNGAFQVPKTGLSQNITQSVAGGGGPGVVTIPETGTGTAIDTSGVTTEGLCYLKNLDLQNFIEIGADDAGTIMPILRLKPQEDYVIRLSPGASLLALADTAPVRLQVNVYED